MIIFVLICFVYDFFRYNFLEKHDDGVSARDEMDKYIQTSMISAVYYGIRYSDEENKADTDLLA